MTWTKEAKAKFINAKFDALGISRWGRASHIKNDIGCSNASAAAMLQGSIPHKLDMATKFCDQYNIDLYQWITGKSRAQGHISEDSLVALLKRIKEHEAKNNTSFSAEQMARLLLMGISEERDMATFLANLSAFNND